MKILLFFLILSSLLGCATTVTERGKAVKIIVGDPKEGCEEIKFLEEHVWMGSIESARNKVREKAGELGATHLRIEYAERPGESAIARGTAFNCK